MKIDTQKQIYKNKIHKIHSSFSYFSAIFQLRSCFSFSFLLLFLGLFDIDLLNYLFFYCCVVNIFIPKTRQHTM